MTLAQKLEICKSSGPMNTGQARELYEKYSTVMAYVAVESADGKPGIGSAFHVGEGVFVTARHVVDGKRIVEVGSTTHTYIRLTGEEADNARTHVHLGDEEFPAHRLENGVMELLRGPVFHPDALVDVAAFQVKEIDPHTPHVPLGGHLDDWLGSDDFVLWEAIIMGYPPIPFTKEPKLVAARAEINALVDLYNTPHVHFILSSMPRGGFSGGLVLTEGDFVLGVVTSSLMADDKEEELGFLNVLTVEPIYNCLAANKMLPDCQAEWWEGYIWNTDKVAEYFDPNEKQEDRLTPDLGPATIVRASVSAFDDGKRVHVEVICDFENTFEAAMQVAEQEFSEYPHRREIVRPGYAYVKIDGPYIETQPLLGRAVEAVRRVFESAGLRESDHSKRTIYNASLNGPDGSLETGEQADDQG